MKVNKYILLIILVIGSFAARAQADTVYAPLVEEVEFKTTALDTLFYNDTKFDRDFQEKYSGSDFKYEEKVVAVSQWDRFWDWVARFIRDIFTFGDASKAASALVIIVRVVAVLIILFITYLIVRSILNKESMWIFGKRSRKISVQDVTEQDIHVMDFDKLITETRHSGNYRLAVRYYYLWLLKKLSVKDVIDWHFDKTNSDYLYEIKDANLKRDFEYLSYLYDYSWYGEFPLDEAAFAKAENAFHKTFNTL